MWDWRRKWLFKVSADDSQGDGALTSNPVSWRIPLAAPPPSRSERHLSSVFCPSYIPSRLSISFLRPGVVSCDSALGQAAVCSEWIHGILAATSKITGLFIRDP